ncbi:HAMP domain-containing sensor histidine kinase [Marinobacter sp.]|uniref:ATP-binding protein n=1 Tax=Marinobacter sp. TaxID=50741 RepID=UPI0025C14BFF|nr:HAMP domain-containing sensor histidine kinase [Marinobacter sp.]
MKADQIRHQQALGFASLRFAPPLEGPYRLSRSAMIRQRARLVSLAGLLIFLVYAAVDALTLPPELARITATIRLTVSCPIIAITLWLAYRTSPSDQAFEKLYTLAYLGGGLSVIAIILVARQQAYPLPYEGMILILMFGYFAMGLPFLSASLASALLVGAYLVAEWSAGTPMTNTMTNGFFLMTANVIGMVGAWISEYRHRAHFLDRQLLNLMHQSAADESRRKTQLITAASHDLRQPLNAIDMTLETFRPEHADDRQKTVVVQLKDTVFQLRRLLETVFDSARLNEGMIQPEIQPVHLQNILQDIHDRMASILASRGIRLNFTECDASQAVLADPSLLQRILQNLITNAAEHSGCDTICIAVESAGSYLRLSVEDNGRGLPTELNDQLFQPYVRGHSQNPPPGLGLGLTIVRELTSLMHGRCGVDSEPEQGCVFWVELPAKASPDAGPC